MQHTALTAALVAAVLLSAPALGGQLLCGPYPLVAEALRSQYGERPCTFPDIHLVAGGPY